ncbi:SAM-dependent methyltransferase [Mumia sp. zg.B53]|uniref:class I SAM-dependent methyltransferase n=1 Tax=unclassified Mumia TaxID=2621872 RepID=UPI001C6E75E3|nr:MULTISPECIES: class I SAM-dependent methyltransferase [unclassified Mumia]MBW9204740.1 SAM-dependent methyltransferase [Mumia sp. zg.B17]MBW9209255.1 SAM-dependent methyltransferase [Mumia sp. zg.B21]MBW9213865.1 SAM-dependent methyltransferase [Mumia sp. zg.B53]MDD9349767.1 class I SAM-dependent methyltransferase [Mumia sp.]
MEVETFERLLDAEGQQVLREAEATYGSVDELTLVTRLRRQGHSPELVAAATSQVALRRRAATKLGADAANMYFTPDALEQATRLRVAAHRAERLSATGARTLVDLGCGIGADLAAFARAGLSVHGVERDPLRAAMARANLAALRLDGTVGVADLTAVDLTPYDAAFVDPARRDGRGRTFDLDAFSPPWSFVVGVLADRGLAKVLPGIAHDLVPDGVEAEWVSDRGDLVEACLWGPAYAGATRRATVIGTHATATLTDADAPTEVHVAAPGDWLYEPDDAVIRAGLVTAVAVLTDGWLVDPHIAYVSSATHVATPYARAFRVLEELPYREKQLRAALRERDVGTLTVKKRGVSVVPEVLVRRLRLAGSETATVVLTRVAGEGRAYLVEPVLRTDAPVAGP